MTDERDPERTENVATSQAPEPSAAVVDLQNPKALTPSQDEIERYRRLRQNVNQPVGARSRFSSFLWFLFVLSALAGGGWLYYQQALDVQTLKTQFPEMQDRLEQATSKNQESDETLTARVTKISEQLAAAENEVRQLWDVANKRNQQWIKENSDALKRQRQDIGELLLANQTIQVRAEEYDHALNVQKDLLERIESIDKVYQQLADAQQGLTDNLNNLIEQTGKIDKRVIELEEAVVAIDRHRKLLTRQKLDIDKRFLGLEKQNKDLQQAIKSAESAGMVEQ